MLRILTLSTLFPDATRPNFGIFVERQTLGLAAHPKISLQAVAPIGLSPGPLRHLGHYAALAKLPKQERWKGIQLHRLRFTVQPFFQGRHHAAALQRALIPIVGTIREDFAFDVIDVWFIFPDAPPPSRSAGATTSPSRSRRADPTSTIGATRPPPPPRSATQAATPRACSRSAPR
ncbi:hypothetical protein QFZ54_003254 [Sphingomonas faeni]|nr:hypothetical protein [Sphingomonas faeni]